MVSGFCIGISDVLVLAEGENRGHVHYNVWLKADIVHDKDTTDCEIKVKHQYFLAISCHVQSKVKI